MKKNTITTNISAPSLRQVKVASDPDKSTPEFDRIVERLQILTSLQTDYIAAIKNKLDKLSYLGGDAAAEEGTAGDRPVPVSINEKLNTQLEYQDHNTVQLRIILEFLNTLV